MSKRERHSKWLTEAAEYLDPVNRASANPQLNIRPAVDRVVAVWREGRAYIEPAAAKQLRVQAISLRTLLAALDDGRSLSREDVAVVTGAAAALRDIAPAVASDPRAKKASVERSARGLRFNSMSEVARGFYAVLSSEMHTASNGIADVEGVNALQVKLPRAVPENALYVVTRMPMLVFPKGVASQRDIDRAGLVGSVIRDVGLRRIPGLPQASGGGDCILLEKQLVLGFNRSAIAGTSGESLVESAIESVSERLGPHACPMPQHNATISSPGNKLAWLWLVPTRVISSRALVVRSASFPWLGEGLSGEMHGLSPKDLEKMRAELETLNAQQKALLQRGLGLDHDHMLRQSVLMEQIDRATKGDLETPDTPEKKLARNAAMRAELEARLEVELQPLTTKLSETRAILEELGKPKDEEPAAITKQRSATLTRIKQLKKLIESERERVMADMRKRLK